MPPFTKLVPKLLKRIRAFSRRARQGLYRMNSRADDKIRAVPRLASFAVNSVHFSHSYSSLLGLSISTSIVTMGLKAVHFGGGAIGRGFVAEKLTLSGFEVSSIEQKSLEISPTHCYSRSSSLMWWTNSSRACKARTLTLSPRLVQKVKRATRSPIIVPSTPRQMRQML